VPPVRALAEAAWIAAVTPRRLRTSRPAICIGGAVLGGTGKTPLAIAVAKYLAPRLRVAIVGHAHRAKPRSARIASASDRLAEVGDEALLCARHAPTVVGPRRQAALDLACEIADIVVLDGVLQLEPRAALSILTLADGSAPSGLARRADVALRVRTTLDVTAVRARAVGVATCLARPERIVRALEEAGIRVIEHRAFPDHGPAGRLRADIPWVATEKCALHLASVATGCDIAVLRHEVSLSSDVRACLDRLAPPPYSEIPRT
jgi:tetraacyldisaccharide 4'-kinase